MRCSTVTLRMLCKCYVEETLECLRSREGKCETAVWDGIGHNRVCVFHQHNSSVLYAVYSH